MNLIFLIFLIFFHFLHGSEAEKETFSASDFSSIFPFIPDEKLGILASSLTNLTNKSESYQVLNQWLDGNWVDPTKISTTTATPPNRTPWLGDLDQKGWARIQGHKYLDYRQDVRNYLEFLKIGVEEMEFFNEQEIQRMESIFWKYTHFTDYDNANSVFFLEMSLKFRKTHILTRSTLKMMTKAHYDVRGYGLQWHVQEANYEWINQGIDYKDRPRFDE